MAPLAAGGTAQAKTVAAAAGKQVCGRYSSFVLALGETAAVSGAGATSVSLLVSGPRGSWLFYDGLTMPEPAGELGTLVLAANGAKAYRRGHDARIYSVVPVQPYLVDGKQVATGVMGVDMMRQPLANPAIVGTDADLAVLRRVRPAKQDHCDLRWMPGVGLVAAR